MILRARVVLTMAGPPIGDGEVAIRRGRVAWVGPRGSSPQDTPGPRLDLGDALLLPGLVNAHCHLDYTMMRGAISPGTPFATWIRRLNAMKGMLADDDFAAAINRGMNEAVQWGTTSLFNIESFPHLIPALPRPPIRVWWFCELIDIRKPHGPFRFRLPGGWLGGIGLSPHSPYTASPALFRRALASRWPITTHVAESREERLMFAERRGPLFDLLKSIGRPMDDCSSPAIVASMFERGLVNRKTLLVHANELDPADFPHLRGTPVAHCPRSHAYFGHSPFRWRELAAAGARICLGTDSLASNRTLSMFDEMRAAADAQPWLKPEEILAAATLHPAEAIGAAGRLGRIAPGAWADLIALPFSGAPRQAAEAALAHRSPVPWIMVTGRWIAHG